MVFFGKLKLKLYSKSSNIMKYNQNTLYIHWPGFLIVWSSILYFNKFYMTYLQNLWSKLSNCLRPVSKIRLLMADIMLK